MGLRTVILQKSKQKTQSSSALPPLSTSAPTSSESTPRQSTHYSPSSSHSQEQQYDPDSYEAFLAQAERDEQDRLELEELERRIRRRNESFNRGEGRDSGTRSWLIANGLSR